MNELLGLMKKVVWLLLIPGLLLASIAVALVVLMESGEPEWTCSCENGEWSYIGPNGSDESKTHLDATGHSTSCKRTDQSAKFMDRVFGLIFPEHED